jgi:hypothetical protein
MILSGITGINRIKGASIKGSAASKFWLKPQALPSRFAMHVLGQNVWSANRSFLLE